jgi:hypothetical protein
VPRPFLATLNYSAKRGARQGVRANVRAFNFNAHNVAYRLRYGVHQDVVTPVAIGPHDTAYEATERHA